MMTRYKKLIKGHALTLGMLPILLISASLAEAAQLYRWTDNNGKHYFSDHLTPEHLKNGYQVLNDKGDVVYDISPPAALTIQARPKVPAAPIEQSRDRALLRTYTSDTDIINARDHKLGTLDTLIHLTERAEQTLTHAYMNKTKEAGDYERRGEFPPASLKAEISTLTDKLDKYRDALALHQRQRQSLQQRYQADLNRYRELHVATNH